MHHIMHHTKFNLCVIMNNVVVVFVLIVFHLIFVLEANNVLNNGVTEDQKKEIVDAHNEFRLQIALGKVPNQPKATNMKTMYWDESLAKKAQIIADKMIFEHEIPDDDRFRHVGQNLAQSASTKYEPNAEWHWAVSRWFDEVKMYSYDNELNKGTGHYTQVIWANTKFVGCGFTAFEDPTEKLQYKKLYVCNYGPGGNIRGMKPYKTGRCGCKGLCKEQRHCISKIQ